MAAGAFGRLGAKLVDDLGMTGDEAARFVDNLDEQTARLLDENPRAVEGDPDALQNVLQQADGGSSGFFDRVPRLGDDTADAGASGSDDLGIIPQSTLGRVGAGAAGTAVALKGEDTLSQYFETQQSEAAAEERENVLELSREVLQNDELSGEQKAAAFEELAGSGIFEPSAGSSESGSGGGGGLLPDDPVAIIVAVVILALVFKYVIGDSNDLSVPSVGAGGGDG
jgi:hypothetical protein